MEELPIASLPFFLPGIPLENAPGQLKGLIRYQESPSADGLLTLDVLRTFRDIYRGQGPEFFPLSV